MDDVSEESASDKWVKEGSSELETSKSNGVISIGEEDGDADTMVSKKSSDRSFHSIDSSQLLEIESEHQSKTPAVKETQTRHEKWAGLLGVKNKPDPLSDWDNLYNLGNQSKLRSDCRLLLERIGKETNVTTPQLESLVTLYCKRRSVDYDSSYSWMSILEKLLRLPFEQSQLFNVFYAITTKYIPRSEKVYDLFRLLLQYHDAELCSHLDSFRILPKHFAQDWFSSLLANNTETKLCWKLWDRYFDKGDPFLIYFIALAFVRNARDKIFELNAREAILDLLISSPGQMNSDDIDDLLEICIVYLNYTPVSVREDFHCMLYGSNFVDEYSEFPLNQLICLPISVQELYRRVLDGVSSANNVFTYFIIDTRAQKFFNSGSIPGSYNLNAHLIVDDPEKYNIAMNSLMKFKEGNCPKDHICFIGSGREEDDQYLMMVISRFLHQNYNNISYVDGGYCALHTLLSDTGNLTMLSNHFNVAECSECTKRDKSGESKGWSLMEKIKKAVSQNKVRSKIKELNTILSSTIENEKEKGETLKHVKRTDCQGKRYRNIKSVFSIEHDRDSDNGESGLSKLETPATKKEKLRWDDVKKNPEIITHFDGTEVTSDKAQVPSHIALTRTHMHIFHVIEKEPEYVYSSKRHSLSSIMKVTSKKRIPEFLTFKFGYDLPTGEAHINQVQCFVIPKAGECAKAVKTAILALRPSVDSDDD